MKYQPKPSTQVILKNSVNSCAAGNTPSPSPQPMKKLFSLLLIPLTILIAAGALVAFLIKIKPEPQQSTPAKIIPRVEVLILTPDTHTPWIETFGTVRSYYQTELASLIAGETIKVSPRFQAGESVHQGEILVELNTADYLANLAKQQSAVASAQHKVQEEDVRAKLARNDWVSSGRDLKKAPDYTLRLPHQEAAKQTLASAQAALAKAKLDLERTKIRAPYDAIVQERSANPGSIVRIGESLGRLIAREKAEVRLPLTPKEVAQLKLPLAFRHPKTSQTSQTNSSPVNDALDVTLTSPAYPGTQWKAKITRTEISIDPKNQVVYVVAEIDHPFDTPNTAPLPIGTFVKAQMQGTPLANTLSLPESSIIDDSYLWIIDQDSKLRRQSIQRLFSSKGTVLARLPDGTAKTTLTISQRPLPSFHTGQKVNPTQPK